MTVFRFFHIISLCALPLLLSCSKEQGGESGTRTVSISIAEFKTTLSPDRLRYAWSEGDKVGIFNDAVSASGYQNKPLSYQSGSCIAITVPASARKVFSIYPYDVFSEKDPSSARVSIPKTQNQKEPGAFNGSYLPMTASSPIENDAASLLFRPAAGVMALNIYNSAASPGETVSRVVVTPTLDSGYAGDFTVDLTADNPSITGGGSHSSGITLELATPLELGLSKPSDPVSFPGQLYVCLAKKAYKAVRFDIYSSLGRIYSLTSNTTKAISLEDKDIVFVNINLATGEMAAFSRSATEEFESESESISGANLPEITYVGADEDSTEDIIPDFSRVGYHFGDDPIPVHTNIVKTLSPLGNGQDDLVRIQAAIDACDGVTPSVIKLTAGTFRVSSTLRIGKNNVVLRGTLGPDGERLTHLLATSVTTYVEGDGSEVENAAATNLIVVSHPDGNAEKTISFLGAKRIIEDKVPCGRFSVRVEDASSFHPGETVLVLRPTSREWIHDLRMDQISDGEYWNYGEYDIQAERYVTAVAGDRIYFENPIPIEMDAVKYTGGFVIPYNYKRVHEVGIEDLYFDSVFDPSIMEGSSHSRYYADENHTHTAVKFNASEHCWARNCEAHHFIFSHIGMGTGAKNITVLDCKSFEPVSLIQGSRRYAYCIGQGAALCLIKRCEATDDRHNFVSTGKSTGPNVFTQCKSSNSYSCIGPHCFLAVCHLYDCVEMDDKQADYIGVEDADYTGTGASQGWQGINHVFWNCKAPGIICQTPWVTGKNYSVGCVGKRYKNHPYLAAYTSDRLDGEWWPSLKEVPIGSSNTQYFESGSIYGATSTERSLYESQLKARGTDRAIPLAWYGY